MDACPEEEAFPFLRLLFTYRLPCQVLARGIWWSGRKTQEILVTPHLYYVVHLLGNTLVLDQISCQPPRALSLMCMASPLFI